MKKVILGLMVVVVIGGAIAASYHVSKESQTALVTGVSGSRYYSANEVTKGVPYGTNLNSSGVFKPKDWDQYIPCPCIGEITIYQTLQAGLDKIIADFNANDKLPHSDTKQQKSIALHERRVKLAKATHAAEDEAKACVNKPENKALYAANPKGACYDASLPKEWFTPAPAAPAAPNALIPKDR